MPQRPQHSQQPPVKHAEKMRRKAVERRHILAAKGGRVLLSREGETIYSAELLEAGLRVYQGRALYEGSLTDEALAPLQDKYGLII